MSPINIGKIIGVNLIVGLGVVFLKWEIFEVAFTYLLETGIAFFISMILHYFVNKDTKVSFSTAFFNVIMFSLPLYGIVAMWAGVIHYLTGPKVEKVLDSFSSMGKRFADFDLALVLLSISVLYLIVFILFSILSCTESSADKNSTQIGANVAYPFFRQRLS